MVTDPQTQLQTHRQDQLQYTVPQLAHSVINVIDTVVAGTEKFSEVTGMKRGIADKTRSSFVLCLSML